MHKLLSLLIISLVSFVAYSQKQVSITIDDVPNSMLYAAEGYRARLLYKIDSMQLPVAIFINEHRILSADAVDKSMSLFNDWIKSPNVIVGHHGYHHAMYSTAGIDSFRSEILKGEVLSKQLSGRYHKKEKYFRFPYNDLGEDAKQHQEAESFLTSKGYIITPYTVHSDDWLVTELYEYYKQKNMMADAKRIGDAFIKVTLEYFDYIETLTDAKLKRNVKQIYLMHDNVLNADYMDKLVAALKKKGYSFITLDDAMSDPVYRQKDFYELKYGVSWVYRWIKDPAERKKLMRASPATTDIEKELELVKKN
ncbi:MAG: polysaccharide deacetylase family protein [Chryseolinea sp.]